MSIIAIKGIPQKWSLIMAVKYFRKAITGPFEALNFTPGKMNTKTLYMSLPEKMDPARVIESIHNASLRPTLKLYAHVPRKIPDFPLPSKKKGLPNVKRAIEKESPHEVIQITHHELLLEIQYKYPGLYNLSQKTGHQLLEEIARVIFERVKDIMSAHVETRENCFKLSSHYRKNHPHFGDFQLILTILHALQDANGAPQLQIKEKDLQVQALKPYTIDDLPYEQVRAASYKYSDKVQKAISAHIKSLDSNICADDTEDSIARKKVREEIKKILPYIPTLVKQVVVKNFTPQQNPMLRIRIYGEPFLPSKDAMSPFVRRYHAGASRIIRHPRMYNLLMFKIHQKQYTQLMAMDGTVVSGAKLVIRCDMSVYEASSELRTEMSAALSGPTTIGNLNHDLNTIMDFD